MRFLHAADLHLDSPLRGLARYEGCPEADARTATRRAFENLVRLAQEESVDVVLLAGDIFDGDWKDWETGLFFANQLGILGRAGIPVVAVSGNHDAASVLTRQLRWPSNVTYCGGDDPSTVRFEHLRLAIHGHGYASRWEHEDLSRTYPDPVPGWVNVGLLHTSAEGHPAHATYAPCRVADLVAKGYDYWALGHVHEHSVLARDPWVVFPGCLQGRHVGEPGRKGCVLVTVDSDRVTEVRFRAVDVLEWATATVPVDGCASRAAVLDRVALAATEASQAAEGRVLALRVRLEASADRPDLYWGDDEWWVNNVRATCTEVSAGPVWLETVRFDRSAADAPPSAGLAALVQAVVSDESAVLTATLARTPEWARVQQCLDAVPAPIRQDALRLDDPAEVAALVQEAAALVGTRSLPGDSADAVEATL